MPRRLRNGGARHDQWVAPFGAYRVVTASERKRIWQIQYRLMLCQVLWYLLDRNAAAALRLGRISTGAYGVFTMICRETIPGRGWIAWQASAGDIAAEMGSERNRVRDWLGELEDAGLIWRSRAYYGGARVEVTGCVDTERMPPPSHRLFEQQDGAPAPSLLQPAMPDWAVDAFRDLKMSALGSKWLPDVWLGPTEPIPVSEPADSPRTPSEHLLPVHVIRVWLGEGDDPQPSGLAMRDEADDETPKPLQMIVEKPLPDDALEAGFQMMTQPQPPRRFRAQRAAGESPPLGEHLQARDRALKAVPDPETPESDRSA